MSDRQSNFLYLLFIYDFVNGRRSFYLQQRVTVANLGMDCYSIILVGEAAVAAA